MKMEALFLLIPLSLVFIALIGALLYWAVQAGQYDDLERPGHEILLDDPDDEAGAGEGDDQS
jgi:cbb3-type cytochrome oxidase maturation protein